MAMPALPSETARRRMIAFAESWHDEASIFLPDRIDDIEAGLPGAIDGAESDLAPSHPGEVIAALQALADRRGFDLPNGIAFEMDIEMMAGWPKDLFQKAFSMVWERFSYRRLPEVADFFRHIELDLAERRERLTRLRGLELRLKTAQQRRRWDEEARARHAAAKERERAAMRAAAAPTDDPVADGTIAGGGGRDCPRSRRKGQRAKLSSHHRAQLSTRRSP